MEPCLYYLGSEDFMLWLRPRRSSEGRVPFVLGILNYHKANQTSLYIQLLRTMLSILETNLRLYGFFFP